MPFILLGYLTHHPKSVKPITATGALYIEDNSAAVVCEVKNHLLPSVYIDQESAFLGYPIKTWHSSNVFIDQSLNSCLYAIGLNASCD